MLQRKAAAGRPTGTDGYDYSYRMVVDSRYTKVAKGKARLKALLIVQGVLQAIGSLLVLLASQERGFENLVVVSVSIGFISLLIGELGRRRSQANLLRLYLSLLAIAIAFTAAHVVRSDLFFKVTKAKDFSSITSYELGEIFYILLGIFLHILAIITTALLLQNMSPKRTA
ncbi:uncharacterized protein LOC110020710 isoform X2 [Phalaenopsis equestris]|uniref:uncharacterized protein LOC110020710 isoform X2 n=1 Tax=Phalaenopsis equestris TaxID=78828 RepID=UPI0009E39DB0|nr:uncharacterized protein LOC110020710 isoform X2 [Phalaenopsis equestris]XP_020574587.1 uncharacterized protein LOC110020710 isoform X2 [Phalaenopsis equestris]